MRRKAEVVAVFRGGFFSLEEACSSYTLTKSKSSAARCATLPLCFPPRFWTRCASSAASDGLTGLHNHNHDAVRIKAKITQVSLRTAIVSAIRLLWGLLLGSTEAMAEYDVKSALQAHDSADSDNGPVLRTRDPSNVFRTLLTTRKNARGSPRG
jgi:Protein of unknown function (DUF1153)